MPIVVIGGVNQPVADLRERYLQECGALQHP
jgi:hypothetical protein